MRDLFILKASTSACASAKSKSESGILKSARDALVCSASARAWAPSSPIAFLKRLLDQSHGTMSVSINRIQDSKEELTLVSSNEYFL